MKTELEIFDEVVAKIYSALGSKSRDEYYGTDADIFSRFAQTAREVLFSEELKEEQERAELARLLAKYGDQS